MTQVTEEMLDTFGRAQAAGGGFRGGIQALFDAKLISLPVDEAAIRESVVREAMALFEGDEHFMWTGPYVRKRLQSLLPTDKAKELAEQWWNGGNRKGAGCYPSSKECAENAFRWLIEREKVNG